MITYKVNRLERKLAMNQLVKEKLETMKPFYTACYYLAIFLKYTAIVCGTANVLHMVFWSKAWHEIFLLGVTFLAPYSLSWLPRIVYVTTTDQEYRFRLRETITFKPEGFLYSYHDDHSSSRDSILIYDILCSQIERLERNERTRVLTLYGNFVMETHVGDKITHTCKCSVVNFMDVYDVDLKQLLEQRLSAEAANDAALNPAT